MSSLQDQLLKAGLVDKKKAAKVSKDKRKSEKLQRKTKQVQVDASKVRAQQVRAEKAEKDRQLNQQRQLEAEQKAVAAQIRQLITMNRIARDGADSDYNFTDGKTIKTLRVSDLMARQLAHGYLAIVKLDDNYAVVPAAVAEKIDQRDASYIVLRNQREATPEDENDPYADYKIPDDLMW
ncbi:DUF2058 domain-containing protein [Exilibacterium tricleocarpae]|uniref:DUF2058 domain-containing protein n=1 Tax=Exilibacterium tricleocarpae TaxID=2591008 RepID=A0A545U3G7_9GAMM|nr:DUF2058 domain-containing protein [Exilibacterium tricleocarpae]TQV84027.1 DUF2058 domain-containing protein [Exilibacterium tricleocarpae]